MIEHGEKFHTSHLEADFVLKLISKLRIDFNQDSAVTARHLNEMLQGGYLKFEDDGSFYYELVDSYQQELHTRTSSHHSSVQQYSFSGPVVKEILFGVSADENGKSATWVQFEKHNTRTLINVILHLIDYLVHKWTGKNIGPYGSSEYTEKNPLVLTPS